MKMIPEGSDVEGKVEDVEDVDCVDRCRRKWCRRSCKWCRWCKGDAEGSDVDNVGDVDEEKVRDVKVEIGSGSVGKTPPRTFRKETNLGICAKVAPNSSKIMLNAKLDTLGIRPETET